MISTPFYLSSTQQGHAEEAIRILIVDDQKVVQAKIQDILSSDSHLKIVGMANDGDQAIAQIKKLSPDVVLMDIEMPKINGIEVTEFLARQAIKTKVLVISTYDKEEYIQKIISAGADGYILKQTPAFEFIAAIYAVYKGYSHFGPSLFQKTRVHVEETPGHLDLQQLQDQSQIVKVDPPVSSDTVPNASTQSITQLETETTGSNLSVVQVEEFLPSIHQWLTWGGIVVMTTLIAIVPLSTVLKYKTKVKAPATVRPQGETRLVQAQTDGQISQILLKPGDVVAKGDLIARIDASQLETQQRQLKQAIAQQKRQLALLQSQVVSIESQIVAESQRNSSEIKGAEAQLSNITRAYGERTVEVSSQLAEEQANRQAAEAAVKASETKLVRYRTAAEQGAITKEQLEETQLELQQQKQDVAAAQARIRRVQATLNPSSAEMEAARQDIGQAKKAGKASLSSLKREKEAIIQQRIAATQELEQNVEELKQKNIDLKRTFIVATAPGEISRLELRNPGQRVQPSQEIAQIIPNNVALELRLLTSPQDISKLELGQRMQMRVSACPYPDYGVLNGHVSRIAKDVMSQPNNESADNSAAAPQAPAVYEIFVKPEDQTFGRKEHQCTLQLGMEGTAEIITKEETVLQFLLRKVRLISNV